MAAGLIDLHTHTNISDGDDTPQQLLARAEACDVRVLAITDHDTVDAYDEALFAEAKQRGIELIPGIELSTIDEQSEQKIHVLGLFIDPYNAVLRRRCAALRQGRIDLTREVATKLAACGFTLRVDELVASGEIITKAHIARDVLDNKANHAALVRAHGALPLQGEFIETWLIKGCPAFVPKTRPLLTHEAIELIHQAGGLASCAHPSFNVMKGFGQAAMEELILRNGFDAVEAINVQYDKEQNDRRVDMMAVFTAFARQSGLLVTGGSDYHSENTALWGRMTSLGMVEEAVRPSMAEVTALRQALERQ